MQSTFSRRAFLAGLGMLSVPLIALAQESREEKKKDAEEKREDNEEKREEAKDEPRTRRRTRQRTGQGRRFPRDRSQPGPKAGSTARCRQVTNRPEVRETAPTRIAGSEDCWPTAP